jgi:hypothetical protein
MESLVAACQEPATAQEAVLRRLLATHRGVDILTKHGVRVPGDWAHASAADPSSTTAAATVDAATATPLQLLQQLPLTTFDDYRPAFERLIAAGREYVAGDAVSQQRWEAAAAGVSGLPVHSFFMTSGTTGKSGKEFPASLDALFCFVKVSGRQHINMPACCYWHPKFPRCEWPTVRSSAHADVCSDAPVQPTGADR